MAIVNNIFRRDFTALEVIEQSDYDFYLGGSRRMSQLETLYINGMPQLDKKNLIIVQSVTDYDFYATYSIGLERFFKDCGFKETNHSYKVRKTYGDPADILLGVNLDGCVGGEYELDNEAVMILEKDNVQVVLRKDAEFYRMVFESIPVSFYYYFLWKSAPHAPNRDQIQPIFNALFAVAHAAQNLTKEEK